MAEAKVISLNTSERVAAFAFLKDFKGGVDVLGEILEDIKAVELNDEDRTKCEWKEQTSLDRDANGNLVLDGEKKPMMKLTGFKWDDEKGGEREIPLQEKTLEYLRATMKEKSEKGEFSASDLSAKAYVSLNQKIK